MSDLIIVALISFAGTLAGTFGGIITSNKLTNYRIEQLEKQVEQYNSIIERAALTEQSVKSAHHRIDNLREELLNEEYFKRNYNKNNCDGSSPN